MIFYDLVTASGFVLILMLLFTIDRMFAQLLAIPS